MITRAKESDKPNIWADPFLGWDAIEWNNFFPLNFQKKKNGTGALKFPKNKNKTSEYASNILHFPGMFAIR